MVARAAKRARVDPGRSEVREDDAQTLATVDAGSVDRVLSGNAIHLIPDPDRAIAAFFRVLKPGGIVCASVWGAKEASPQFTLDATALAACRERGEIPADASASTDDGPVRDSFHLGSDDAA